MADPLRCNHFAHPDYAQLYERLVSELTDTVVFFTDPTGCIVSWNPGVEKILGYSEVEWLGQPAHIIFTSEDRADGKPEEEMAKALREGRTPDIRWHQRKDGSRVFIDGTMVALTNDVGTLLGFSKVMRDITERKRIEDTLFASEARLQALVKASSDVLYSMNADWSEMRQLGGGGFIPDTEVPDKDWLQKYIHPEDRPRITEAIQKAVSTSSVFELEHRVRRVDGTLGWTLSKAVPLSDDRGTIIEWFGAASDITAQKAAEEERERLMTELARSNEDLSHFARAASHDLKAPLNTILQFAKLLSSRYKGKVLDETAEEFLGLIASSAQRMVTLISDLLRYATLSSSPAAPARVIRADSMVNAALANLEGVIRETQAVVRCGALPAVKLEEVLQIQLFQNLIENAIKYRGMDAPDIYIGAVEQDDCYLFRVKDNGIGIEESQRENIFKPFKRLHGFDIPGTGMGLAICKKIVERAGGSIWVESEPGKGSTFCFTLSGG